MKQVLSATENRSCTDKRNTFGPFITNTDIGNFVCLHSLTPGIDATIAEVLKDVTALIRMAGIGRTSSYKPLN